MRSVFLVRDDTIVGAWKLETPQPGHRRDHRVGRLSNRPTRTVPSGLVAAWPGANGGRANRERAVRLTVLAVVLYLAAGALATWPAVKETGDAYLAQAAPGYGEAAAGDHLQLGWAFWLVGHQIENVAPPWEDPYSFQPVSEAPPNLQGWLFGLPYWPLDALAGPIWAYDILLLLSFALAGCVAALWLRALGLTVAAALAGGLVFTLAPYRVAQSTGHLLGMIAFLIPAALYAIEKRRLAWAGLALAAIPLSGQLHVAGGAVALALAYALVRLPRSDWPAAVVATVAPAAAAIGVYALIVDGSIAKGRSFNQVERYSAEAVTSSGASDGSSEELVFLGWVTLALAIVGLAVLVRSRQAGLAVVLGLAVLVPCLLALGAQPARLRMAVGDGARDRRLACSREVHAGCLRGAGRARRGRAGRRAPGAAGLGRRDRRWRRRSRSSPPTSAGRSSRSRRSRAIIRAGVRVDRG